MKSSLLSASVLVSFFLAVRSNASECGDLEARAEVAVCQQGCTFQEADTGGCPCDVTRLNEFLNAIKNNQCNQGWTGSAGTACQELADEYTRLGCNWK
jgi:hypothetical protein